MNITDYFNSQDKLENKEKVLFELFDELDIESFNLFSEILDLSDESYYKLDSLYKRCNSLIELYLQALIFYREANLMEASSYSYAARRFLLKELLTIGITINAFIINFILGIGSFVLLSNKATKEFASEIDDIYTRLDLFDYDKSVKTWSTLDNCVRLLSGKRRNILKNIITNTSKDGSLLHESNAFITEYLNNGLLDDVDKLPDNVKKKIISILKHDLNTNNSDIFELLSQTKDNNIKRLQMIKKYQ